MHASMSIRTLHARTLAWSPDIEIQNFSIDLVFPTSKQTILIENSNPEIFWSVHACKHPACTVGWSTVISTLESWGTHWIFCSQWTQKDHIEPNFWLEMGPSYWPRLMLLEQTGPSGRQLRRPFWAICHCERGSEMCLELTSSLWGFQKWCENVESDQKWPSYGALKITNFQKSE